MTSTRRPRPVEAALNWAIQKVRRTGGARAGGFPGAAKVLGQLDGTVPLERKRVGLAALERVPVREHTELQDTNGARVGEVTSGLLGPTINRPVAMGYVQPPAGHDRHPRPRHGARQAGGDGSFGHAVRAEPLLARLNWNLTPL